MQTGLSKSIKVARIAAIAMVAATAPTLADSFAQKNGLPAECAVGTKEQQLQCGIDRNRKIIAASKARGAAADARGAAADARKAKAERESAQADAVISSANQEVTCMKVIMGDLEKGGEKTANLTEPPKRGDACKTMKTLGLSVGSSG